MKIKLISEAPSPRWIPTVGEVAPGETFEIEEEESKRQRLENGPFKRTTKTTIKKEELDGKKE